MALKASELVMVGVHAGRPSFLPVQAMQAVSFSDISRRNDTARAFSMAPETVGRCRTLVAASGLFADRVWLQWKGARLLEMGFPGFVSAMQCDATSAVLHLPMLGLEFPPASVPKQLARHGFGKQIFLAFRDMGTHRLRSTEYSIGRF